MSMSTRTDCKFCREGSHSAAHCPVLQEPKAIELALGRIFRMGARATQPGDIEEYERCRAIIMTLAGA